MNCTLCETILDNKIDNYYFVCAGCGAYLKDEKYYISSKQEKERYEKHKNDFDDKGYQNFTAPLTNAILENQRNEHFGLDYGCGKVPIISKQLIDKGYRVKLFDPYFYNDQDYLYHKYDYILSCEVFEHFYKPKKEIEKLTQLLKPDGYIYIMTHLYHHGIDFKNWYYRRDPTHVFIYTTKTIEFIVNKYNFKLEKMTDRLVIMKKHNAQQT